LNTKRTRRTVSEADVAVAVNVDVAAAAKTPARSRARPVAAAPAVVASKPARKRATATATGIGAVAAGSERRKPASATAATAKTAAAASTTPRKSAAPGALMEKPLARRAGKRAPAQPSIDMQVRDAVVARLDAMKANDLKVIDVRGKTSITDFLVIVSGTSTRHVKSMGDEVVVTAKKFGMPPMGIEGEKDAEWMLVDLGDTVVHLMLPRIREFYGLERLWTLAGEARAAAFMA
jgi:ribosome silencing factor RsfS/YbeB/iojap